MLYIYVCSLLVTYDKLPYTRYMLTKLVTPWKWPEYGAETCRNFMYYI